MLVCIDCKFLQGHPLTYCPGCGKRLVKMDLTSTETTAMREQNWRIEGMKDIYEYFYNGQLIDWSFNRSDWFDTLLGFLYDVYPWATTLDKKIFKSSWGDRTVNLYYTTPELSISFYKPKIWWRLKGSTLPISENDNTAKTNLKNLLGIDK